MQEGAVSFLPALDEVDFVGGDDEGRFVFFEDFDAFFGLGLEAFVDVDDEDGDVGEVAAACAEVDEGGVTGGVDE